MCKWCTSYAYLYKSTNLFFYQELQQGKNEENDADEEYYEEEYLADEYEDEFTDENEESRPRFRSSSRGKYLETVWISVSYLFFFISTSLLVTRIETFRCGMTF